MAEQDTQPGTAPYSLEDLQHWTWVIGRAQQMLLTHTAKMLTSEKSRANAEALLRKMATPEASALKADAPGWPTEAELGSLFRMQSDLVTAGMDYWSAMLNGSANLDESARKASKDRRFGHESWHSHPLFETIAQTYVYLADRWLEWADNVDGIDPELKQRLRFGTQTLVDALAPSNFLLTNPQVLERTIETRGDNLLKGLENMLRDLSEGQLTQTRKEAFEIGRDIASTPGKVIFRTRLYEIIHYAPTTDEVLKTPLVIFPPWINRYYILDLSEKKSFVRWAVDQGISVFMVSWKSADAEMGDITLDDYIAAQMEAVDQVCAVLKVASAHVIGYCVAGTTLAATLAVAAAKGEAERFASATFLTAQVDFSEAGDLKLFMSPESDQLLDQIGEGGYVDGRYLAATFNMLRGRDLIWSYVVNNYLLGEDYAPFDMLYWNGDSTNLPSCWHRNYVRDFYRNNLLVEPGAIEALGEKIDLGKVTTPSFIQAGRDDHIAPPQSVWKIMNVMGGDKTFLLAGSGHIAGVVNPPAANKYQHWTNDAQVETLDEYIAGATEHPGSWWPRWVDWLREIDSETVPVKGARRPGKGRSKAIEDAPGQYVRMR